MPKLTLRDLFAVVTIVTLALGSWLIRSEERVETAAMVMALFTISLTTGTVVWALWTFRRKVSFKELIAIGALWCVVSAIWGAFLAR
ncbi:MAG: hypothetical protein KY475_24385 [Planctomycetes bacterium]|nr:hypothetical protein [Planctomycetota bacterium]